MNWNPRNRKYTKLIQKLLPAKYTAPLYLLMIKMSAILFRYENSHFVEKEKNTQNNIAT